MRGVRAFFIGMLVVLIFALLLPGCSTLERAGEHPVFVRIAVSQAVLGYIEGGKTTAEVAQRKRDLVNVLTATLSLIDADTNASVDSVLNAFVGTVNWDSLSVADEWLAIEAIALVQAYLNSRVQSGELQGDTVLLLRGVVQNAIDSANYL